MNPLLQQPTPNSTSTMITLTVTPDQLALIADVLKQQHHQTPLSAQTEDTTELEPIVVPPSDRMDLYISDEEHTMPHVFQLKLDIELRYWPASKIELGVDKHQWDTDPRVTDFDRQVLSEVLKFFLGADGMVLDNLILNLMQMIQDSDARAFFAYQCANEQVHNETYNKIAQVLFANDPRERERMRRAPQNTEFIAAKQRWIQRWIDTCQGRPDRIAQLLVAFMCVEGIFFSSSFLFIFWFKQRGLFPGISMSNLYIFVDEAYHMMNLMLIYRHLRYGLEKTVIRQIFREAVAIEKQFASGVLGVGAPGLTPKMAGEYIEYSADRILRAIQCEPLFDTRNPFEWMDTITAEGKDNFFEKRVVQYELEYVANAASKTVQGNATDRADSIFKLDEDV